MSLVTDTTSDFSEDLQDGMPKKVSRISDNLSDDFTNAFFEEQHTTLQLKPSCVQQKAEQIGTDNDPDKEEDEEDRKTSVQSSILSEYLKPTSILSKYQRSEVNVRDEAEEEEEEEKMWRTQLEEQPEQEEEKEHDIAGVIISYDSLFHCLCEQAAEQISITDICVQDFRHVSYFNLFKMALHGTCRFALKSQGLKDERNLIFKLAKLKLAWTDQTHNRMMQTLWMKLTDDTRECSKSGAHWQQIGFQGNDPSSDIRGCGLFGVLQLLFAADNYEDIISKVYLLSLDKHQQFPLAIVSFSVSCIVLRLLRSCMLHSHINNLKNESCSVTLCVHEMHAALLFEFYLKWKKNTRTIMQFDEASKELEYAAFNNWHGLLKQLHKRQEAPPATEQQELLLTMTGSQEKGVVHVSDRHSQYVTA